MSAHACRIDYSRETGTLVVCTCGFVLGPFRDRANAVEEARQHRQIHAERYEPTPEQRERHKAAQKAKRAAAKARRNA